ncbi:DgyrCDS9692 [Dimorphilus gyrociliatus]|uniref:DgyrCDS9692 n=1 Tax=Dimorphilus gyrociliatus TaxID=2664684 RepID=A0A7I8VXR7_9ANNE|nr:DgyrCDS9692 [Dimorphilus gyrociliatus]
MHNNEDKRQHYHLKLTNVCRSNSERLQKTMRGIEETKEIVETDGLDNVDFGLIFKPIKQKVRKRSSNFDQLKESFVIRIDFQEKSYDFTIEIKPKKTLRDALFAISKKSGISTLDSSKVEVRIENSRSPLSLDSPVCHLANLTVIATVNEEDFVNIQDILEQFRHHLPALPSHLYVSATECDSASMILPDSWTVYIDYKKMDEAERKRHNIIWETLQFESSYLKKLKTLVDVYVSPYYNLLQRGFFTDLDMKLVVSNLKEMYFQCCSRWNNVILPFINSIKKGNLMEIEDFKNLYNIRKMSTLGDDDISDLFQEEHIYHMTVDKLKEYIKNVKMNNQDFNKFYSWVNIMLWGLDKHELNSYLTAPMHHLTRHTLFLERLIKSTNEKETLEKCSHRIKNFLKGVEAEICMRERLEVLTEFQTRIESYDFIDPVQNLSETLKKSLRICLTSSMAGCPEDWLRRLIREGVVRMKESHRHHDVILCLFTDFIMICRKGRKVDDRVHLKIYKPPMRLDVISVYQNDSHEFSLVYKNEMNFITSIFVFQSADPWFNDIQRAKCTYREMWDGKKDENDELTYSTRDYSSNDLFPTIDYRHKGEFIHQTPLDKSQSIGNVNTNIKKRPPILKKSHTWGGKDEHKPQLKVPDWNRVQKLVLDGQLEVS